MIRSWYCFLGVLGKPLEHGGAAITQKSPIGDEQQAVLLEVGLELVI